ncbi:hypothetical protein BSN85_35380 [Bradyrhizobium brasilense]|uniref:hypothetical protein n=1 Tax=Bradyrhizobium brasilense TaxID=1419277 RepID=UPI000977AA67|nr:hypothetical protein [Bradyrhizobium brasilense]OMI00080.1 hypothetical protein BSN85_35380 [Bradyrhizobium brasilense]
MTYVSTAVSHTISVYQAGPRATAGTLVAGGLGHFQTTPDHWLHIEWVSDQWLTKIVISGVLGGGRSHRAHISVIRVVAPIFVMLESAR